MLNIKENRLVKYKAIIAATDVCLHSLCSLSNSIIMSTASVHCPQEISILEGIDLLEMYCKSQLGLEASNITINITNPFM